MVVVLLTSILTSLWTENSVISWSLSPRWPPTTTSSTSPSLLVNHRSSEAPPLVGSLTSCVRKLSSSTHSRNLLDCFLSAVLYFQQYLVSWSPPREQGLAIVRLLPASYRKLHLPLHPGWVVCNRPRAACLLCWLSPLSLPISIWPYHRNRWALYDRNSPQHTELPHLLSFLTYPFWRSYRHALQHSSRDSSPAMFLWPRSWKISLDL